MYLHARLRFIFKHTPNTFIASQMSVAVNCWHIIRIGERISATGSKAMKLICARMFLFAAKTEKIVIFLSGSLSDSYGQRGERKRKVRKTIDSDTACACATKEQLLLITYFN